MPGQVRRRATLAQQTADRLRSELVEGRWAEGERLPSEAALAEEYGVGRSTAREAVQTLARDGMVEVRHGTGIFAASAPPVADVVLNVEEGLRRARIVEVYEVRRAVEVEAARLAATRATADDLTSLRARLAARQELRGGDTPAYVAADHAFHQGVVDAARNRLLAELFAQLEARWRAANVELVDDEPQLPDTSDDHEALMRALEARDPVAAVGAVAGQFDTVIALLGA